MTWTYSGNPSSSEKDAVRFLIGDTRTASQLVSDEEIAWALAQQSNNIYTAAAVLAESIASYFATKPQTTEIGPLRIDNGQRAKEYRDLAQNLRSRAGINVGLDIYAGSVDLETTDKQSQFSVGMDDFPSVAAVTEE